MTTTHSGTTVRHITAFCKTCKQTFDATSGDPCPGCGDRFTMHQPNYLELHAKLYGTDACPRYNEGLGAWTRGKSDRSRIAREKKLVPADEG